MPALGRLTFQLQHHLGLWLRQSRENLKLSYRYRLAEIGWLAVSATLRHLMISEYGSSNTESCRLTFQGNRRSAGYSAERPCWPLD